MFLQQLFLLAETLLEVFVPRHNQGVVGSAQPRFSFVLATINMAQLSSHFLSFKPLHGPISRVTLCKDVGEIARKLLGLGQAIFRAVYG